MEKTQKESNIRVRIAPSPTGHLHLGTVRTALYNYLFAKKEGGVFVMRTEDTDMGRSLAIHEQEIIDGLKTLGLMWDEGPDVGGPYAPYRQSERSAIYKTYLQKLLDSKKAYYCFCSKEELEAEKSAMLSQGLVPRYSGKCRSLTDEQIEQYRLQGNNGVVRLIVPNNVDVEFHDMIRGKIVVNTNTMSDMVIAKSLDAPLYNFAVVVDDYEMHISHVIRGEDHISNTPKQILIQRALDIPEVKYAHLPLILSPDRKKLSKRSLETSFVEYINDGYLPQAIINFLVLLGWHPEDDREIFSLDEMVKEFSIKRVQKAGGVFSMDKLDWFNAYYIKNLSLDELFEIIKKIISPAWLENEDLVKKVLSVERERMKKLSDFSELASFFFVPDEYDVELLRWHDLSLSDTSSHLTRMRNEIAEMHDALFTQESLESHLMPIAESLGRGESLWPLRVALSGRRNSPGPFEIIHILGRTESLARIDAALEKIGRAM